MRTIPRYAALLGCLALVLPCGVQGRSAVLRAGSVGKLLALVLPPATPLPPGVPLETEGEEGCPESEEARYLRPPSNRSPRHSVATPLLALAFRTVDHGPTGALGRFAPGGPETGPPFALHLLHCVWLC